MHKHAASTLQPVFDEPIALGEML
jgi:hypothetical protein